MFRGIRKGAAIFAAFAMIAMTAAPAVADNNYDPRSNAPAMVDVLILRPMGFAALVVGTGVFLAVAPVVLISRPHEIHKPFYALMGRPAQYVWRDPIGSH